MEAAMFKRVIVGVTALLSVIQAETAAAAWPSTPTQWDQFYSACIEGLGNAQPGIPKPSVPTTCGCIRDAIRKTPEADRDKTFPQIQGRCVQSARTSSTAYPPAAVDRINVDCMKRTDIPKAVASTYCSCYMETLQVSVPWNDYMTLEAAANLKGIRNLDDSEKKIFGKLLETDFYCSQKVK